MITEATSSQPKLARLIEVIRFYQVAAVNALFGFSVYALFVWLGMNIYVAQISAHCLGVAFNYRTYSRHVFRQSGPAKLRFIGAYGFNYALGLVSLLVISHWVASPYLAGFGALFVASIVNYFALKYIVFMKRVS